MPGPQKIKILHYIWSANFGGIEKLVINLVKEQQKDEDLDVCLLIGCEKGDLLKSAEAYLVKYKFGGLNSGYDLSPSKFVKIRNLMKGYDIIHIHTFNILVCLAAVGSKAKIVYTIHGNFNLGREVRLNDKISNFFKKIILNNFCQLVTFNSKWSRMIAEQKFGLRKTNKTVIYNGSIPAINTSQNNIDVFNQYPVLKDKFIVGTCSRFNGFKRIDRLIDSFSDFCMDKPETVLLLVGDGEMRSKYEKRVNDKKIYDKTIFTGFQENVEPFQKIMNVCVYPSQGEPFGLAALETLSMGKPTIMFKDAGGMLEIQGDQSYDDIVEDVNDLTKRLNFYFNTRYANQSNHINSRIENAARFSFGRMMLDYKKCYTSILHKVNQFNSAHT